MLTNKLNLPKPFVDAATSDYKYKDKQYSVTTLLKGSTQAVLERRFQNEIENDVADKVWLIFGTAVHKILEESQETKDQLKEEYIKIDIANGYKLSGIFDLYDEKEKKVVDYKTGTCWKVIYNDWEDYRKQLLIYAYMLRKIGFECTSGEIVMFLKDHSKTKASVDRSYPQYPVHIQKFSYTEQDFKNIEKFINEKFKNIKKAENTPTDELPPCSEEERWHESDKWAVMKKGRKSAVRVLESEEEAQKYIEEKELDNKHYIEFREGKDKKCLDYCPVAQFCPFFKKKYGDLNEGNSKEK